MIINLLDLINMTSKISFVFKLLFTVRLVFSQERDEGIIGVRLNPDRTTPTASNIGGVEVQFKENKTSSPVWVLVCKRGNHENDEDWGREETLVTCRHLGYLRGWSYTYTYQSDSKSMAIDDVQCDLDGPDHLNRLWDCRYDGETFIDGVTGCGPNNRVGVKCYDSASVRLVDNPADRPNQGFLEIKYDIHGTNWMEVCFNGTRGPTEPTKPMKQLWTLDNARLVCKQLGYPDVMRTYKGIFYNRIIPSIDNFNCKGHEQLIAECSVDEPQPDSCPDKDKVEIICFIPGYVGCFSEAILPSVYMDDDTKMTISKCLDYCRKLGPLFKFAGLTGGTDCRCGTADIGTELDDRNNRLSNEECQSPCGGEKDLFCGGQNRISIYKIDNSVCTDPGTPANAKREGDFFSYGSVIKYKCDLHHRLIGEATIQCIMDSSNNVRWNGSKPYCQGPPKTTTAKTPTPVLLEGAVDHPVDIGLLVGILAAALLLIVLIIASICLLFWRKKAMREDNIAAGSISGISSDMVYASLCLMKLVKSYPIHTLIHPWLLQVVIQTTKTWQCLENRRKFQLTIQVLGLRKAQL
ncbi:uncharacterized protein [Amphiura filiformis]|uniref:uncharacterized protein n=1 Tax=Amphiura filiformis TaxID=82378 RepID=UPI003B2141A3